MFGSAIEYLPRKYPGRGCNQMTFTTFNSSKNNLQKNGFVSYAPGRVTSLTGWGNPLIDEHPI